MAHCFQSASCGALLFLMSSGAPALGLVLRAPTQGELVSTGSNGPRGEPASTLSVEAQVAKQEEKSTAQEVRSGKVGTANAEPLEAGTEAENPEDLIATELALVEQLSEETGPAREALLHILNGDSADDRDGFAASWSTWSMSAESLESADWTPGWKGWSQGPIAGRRCGSWDEGVLFERNDWLDRLRSCVAPRGPFIHLKSKVIGATISPTGSFNTKVLLEFSNPSRAQAWIRLSLDWSQAPGRSESPQGHWRPSGGHVLEIETSQAERPMFAERTAAVLATAPNAKRFFSLGGSDWASRLDDAAASAWFGHQGMAVGDVNGDSFEDLYVGMPSGVPNQLLLQQADGTLREAPAGSGVSWQDDTKGVLLIDLDGDGDRDLVAALHHVLVLHKNDGAGTFEVAGWCVAPDESPFYSIAAADVDGDGDLDLFGTRYVRSRYGDSIPIPYEDARNGPSNHLYINSAPFRFTDGTEAAGLMHENDRFSLAASFSDFDGDGDSDLYVANDFGRNRLWRNTNGKFEDVAASAGVQDQAAGMGVSWADANGDGKPDLYVSNMYSSAGKRIAYQPGFGRQTAEGSLPGIQRHAQGNSLWVQSADSGFGDVSDSARVRMGRWSWGAIFTDLNGDGWPDLYAPNGFMTGPSDGDL